MSVHVITWVLEHSETKLGSRLVLIVLADHAKKDGTAAWPSVATMAHEARLSPRQVQRCLRELVRDGHITQTGKTKAGTNVYAVNMKGRQSVTPEGDTHDTAGVTSTTAGLHEMSPEPSLNRPEPSTPLATPRKRDVAFDVLAEVTNAMVTREGGAVGSVLADLRREHPDLDDAALSREIRLRADAFKRQWPGHSCTPTALGRHWKRLASGDDRSATITELTTRARRAS